MFASDSSPSKAAPMIRDMFDRVAKRYDLLNRLLSFGQDVRWRKRLEQALPSGQKLRLLDLATGTGDILLSLTSAFNRGKILAARGIDLSSEMLHFAERKIKDQGLSEKISLAQGDATRLNEASNTFDVLTMAFGIRNVEKVDDALSEMRRVLKPGGRALILEFSIPKNLLVRGVYLFYFRIILPFFGGLISGQWKAYKYLNKTAEAFPYGDAFCSLMEGAGFKNVKAMPLTFGVATLYQGDIV